MEQNSNQNNSNGYHGNNQMYYYQPPNSQQQNSIALAVVSMVLGIISLVLYCFYFISAICAVLALIFGAISLFEQRGGRGMAIAGIVCASVALVLVFICITAWQGFWTSWRAFWEALFDI